MCALVRRPRALARVREALRVNPIAVLPGPRQSGKTTLARVVAEEDGAAEVFTDEISVLPLADVPDLDPAG